MIVRTTDQSYSYIKGGGVTVSCTLNVLSDDELTVIATTGLSYTADMYRQDLKEIIAGNIASQAQEFIDQLKVIAGTVYEQFGTTDFDIAVSQILADATSRVEV